MAEKNKLASIPGQPMPERRSNLLADLWDEASGAFARYGRRSAAQRDASLALLNQAVDPNTDPFTGAGMKALGLAGLVTHPLAFFPTREEWDQRLQAAGNDSRIGRSIGGFLSDLPSLIDPQMAAGGAATVAPAIFAGMMAKTADLNKLKQAEKLAELGHSAEDIHDMTGWFKGADGKWRFEIDDSLTTLQPEVLQRHAEAKPGTSFRAPLSEVMLSDELNRAYDLSDATVDLGRLSKGGMGGFDPNKNSIELYSTADPEILRRGMLHEIQHLIQKKEGFAPGGDPSKVGADVYKRLMGEVEARNVELRRNMTPAERASSAPWLTEDVPQRQQVDRRK